MDNQVTPKFILDGHYLHLYIAQHRNDDNAPILHIEAEHRTLHQKYSRSVTTTEVIQITQHKANSVQELLFMLLDGCQKSQSFNNTSGITVQLIESVEKGKTILNIIYEEVVVRFNTPFKTRFIIALEKEETKDIPLLYRITGEIGKRIDETVGITAEEFQWDITRSEANAFELSEDKKSIKRVSATGWKGAQTNKPLPASGKHRVSIVISELPANSFMFGISSAGTQYPAYTSASGWMLHSANKHKCSAGATTPWLHDGSNSIHFRQADIITVVVDVDHLMIGYEVNGFPLGLAFQLPQNTNRNTLFPTVDINSQGIQLTLL
mmetsp:Transcript_18437/g.25837  ORF Transcript_18437/g.25837 Transcript_18437/m.25837 type:complete len:323 (+) Transcript_18437:132-1100(+)